jgi:F-type H+-transporting ATPase subunit gamma
MASLKDLRVRIASVKSTQKITKAMQMVSAAKLRRAQEAAESARPYSERMARMLADLAGSMAGQAGAPPLLVGTGKDDVHLLVVVTAERGLAGAFNTSILRAARVRIRALRAAGKQVKILTVGKKGNDSLRRDYRDLIVDYVTLREVRSIGFAQADEIASRVAALFQQGAFDVCTLYFNLFKSVIAQLVTAQQLIPMQVAAGASGGGAPDLGGAIYEYEPDEETVLAELAPRNLAIQIYRALLESQAAEQAARMTAMDNATRNAGEMIGKLTLTYNRTRQAAITKELIEIVSGAEAL